MKPKRCDKCNKIIRIQNKSGLCSKCGYNVSRRKSYAKLPEEEKERRRIKQREYNRLRYKRLKEEGRLKHKTRSNTLNSLNTK